MKLSPLELRKHQFAKRFRLSGFDADEVNGFVRQMADQWAELLEDNRRLEERNRELLGKLTHYEKVELALQEALETSRNTARQLEDNAQKKAELTVEEAELRAQRMLQDAEQERFGIKQDLVRLNSRQSEIAARMRAFLMAEMEVLAQFQGDDPSGFIRLVSANEAGPTGMLAQQATQNADPEVEASEEVNPKDVPEDFADPENDVAIEEVGDVEPTAAALADEQPPDAEPVITAPPIPTFTPPPLVEEFVAATEPPPPPRPIEPDEPTQMAAMETAQEPASTVYSRPPLPPSTPVQETVLPDPPPMPPPPVWPPVEEATIMAPTPSPAPTGLESVEQLMAQTPPPLPPMAAEEAPRPTYRDMLSGTQPEQVEETANDPFNSSFFESPFSDGKPSAEEQAQHAVPGSDAAQDWSLRSLVTGDGDHEPLTPSTSESERDRIRRILEDLD